MEKYKANDKAQDAKDVLLRKCRDTIQKMETEIVTEKSLRIEAEDQNRDLLNEYLYMKQSYDDLESKWLLIDSEQQDRIDEETTLQKKVFDLTQHIEKLESLLETEQIKCENANSELEKYSDFIEELQEELRAKQDALSEWNEAVTSVEQKLLDYSDENTNLKEDLDKYLNKCESLFEENQQKERQLEESRKDYDQIKEKIFDFFEIKSASTNITIHDIIAKIDQEKKEQIAARKEKNSLAVKVKELNEKCECMKNLYEGKLKSAIESTLRLESDFHKTQQRSEQNNEKLLKKKEKIVNLKRELELGTQVKSKIKGMESDYRGITDQNKILKQNLKNKEEELAEKNSMITTIQDRLNNLEISSIRELDFLKSGIHSLKECFNLEITKNEQEILLKFQNSASINGSRERELIDEIQFLQEECEKIKSHYAQIIRYKEEEKSILEENAIKLKQTIVELEERVEHLGSRNDFGERKNFGPDFKRELAENNMLHSDKREKFKIEERSGGRIEGSEHYQRMIDRKENEFNEFKAKFDERLRKKVQQTQEKILVWKNRIREDLSSLKVMIMSERNEKPMFLIEKIEKTVSMII